MHPTNKYTIREQLLQYIYPHEDYIKKHLIEYNEIRQYLNNLLNLCKDIPEMYEVLPPALHQILPNINRRIDPEKSIRFIQEYVEFKQKSVEVDIKLHKLLTLKFLTT